MKYLLYPLITILAYACSPTDDAVPYSLEPIFIDNPSTQLSVDIVYVVPDSTAIIPKHSIDTAKYMDFLNGCFFHRHDIGMHIGAIKTMVDPELYDLTDNRGNETSVFKTATQDTYQKDRLNIYIIPRSNTIALAGIALNQRALITEEFIYESTSPHEIGHALGLDHIELEGNIMSQIKPYARKSFAMFQVADMIQFIDTIQ